MTDMPAAVPTDYEEREDAMPGARLREARERLGLTVGEAAERLHLPPSLVSALEADDYGRFSAPIYVSGFLRNYARMLNLSPEPLVEAYEQLGVAEPPILKELTTGTPRRREFRPDRAAGYVVFVGLMSLIGAWIFTRPADVSPPSGELATTGPAQRTVATPAPEPFAAPESLAVPQPLPAEPAVPVSASVKSPAAPSASAHLIGSAPRAPRDTDVRAAARAVDEFVVHFNEDSWVEISDGAGRQLLFRMGRAGETERLRGTAPFDVLLGNAPGVAIEYNGKPLDRMRANRLNVSSFRLGDVSE